MDVSILIPQKLLFEEMCAEFKSYHLAWAPGFEVELWKLLADENSAVLPERRKRFEQLVWKAWGWFIMDDAGKIRFLTMPEWLLYYVERI